MSLRTGSSTELYVGEPGLVPCKRRVQLAVRGACGSSGEEAFACPLQHRSLQGHRRGMWETVSAPYAPKTVILSQDRENNPGSSRRTCICFPSRPYRLYWFCFFSAWRSSPNWMSRSISSGYVKPLAAHNLGYMLIEVNPGMVLISFR